MDGPLEPKLTWSLQCTFENPRSFVPTNWLATKVDLSFAKLLGRVRPGAFQPIKPVNAVANY